MPVDRPVAGDRPFVQTHLRRLAVGDEALGALRAKVVLRGAQVVPVGGYLDTAGAGRHHVTSDAAHPGFNQQLLYHRLGLVVVALSELVMPDRALRVDEVE